MGGSIEGGGCEGRESDREKGCMRLPERGSMERRALLAVCALAVLVFLNSLGNGFAQDDRPIIEWNPHVHGVGSVLEAVTTPYWPNTPSRLALYRPVTSATYAVDWSIWGGAPLGFHLTNVLLHAGVTGLLFLLLLGLGAGGVPSAIGAAVFAVHPVHVEAVANVVGRAELLAALFVLAAALRFLRPEGGWGRAALIGVLAFLAVGSKESGIVLPGVLFLLLLREGGAPRGLPAALQEEWRCWVAVGSGVGLYLLLRGAVTGVAVGGDLAPWYWGEPTSTALLTSVRLWPEYLRLLLFPARLLPDYGPGVILPQRELFAPGVLLGLLLGLLTLGLALTLRSRVRLLSLGWLWFVGTVLPVSGLLIENSFLLAERTLYLPSVGLSLGVAGGTAYLLRGEGQARRSLVLGSALLLVLLGAGRSWLQNPVWRSDATLFSYLVERAPENYRARMEMAARLVAAGRSEEALREMQAAARLVPGHLNVRLALGGRLLQVGALEEALRELDAARRIAPEAEVAQIFYLSALGASGRVEEAIGVGREVIERFPANPLAWHFLSHALAARGELVEARSARLEAIRLDSGEIGWEQWIHLALIAHAAGDEGAREEALAEAAREAPLGQGLPEEGELDRWIGEGRVLGMPPLRESGSADLPPPAGP